MGVGMESSPIVSVGHIVLEVVDTQLFLGLGFDSKLSWVYNVYKNVVLYLI